MLVLTSNMGTNPSQIPKTTLKALNAFHQAHFGVPAPASHTNPVPEEFDKDDDGLGYYDDGVKRTLTDEQIAIFRHSEIYRLWLKRERKREEEAEAREVAEAEGQNQQATGAGARERTPSPHFEPAKATQGRSGVPKNAFKAADPHRPKSKYDYRHEPIARQKPRRRARELDDKKAEKVELDY